MYEIKEMLERADFTNLISYLIYGMEAQQDTIVNYDNRIRESYETFFSRIEELYHEADRENNNLFDIVSEFSTIHDNIYFEVGVLVGNKLQRGLEQGYKKDNIQLIIKNLINLDFKQDIDKNSILGRISDFRTEEDFEETIRQDKNCQIINKKIEKEVKNIDEIGLDNKQWQTIDSVLSAYNERSSEYIRIAYIQGFKDAVNLLMVINEAL